LGKNNKSKDLMMNNLRAVVVKRCKKAFPTGDPNFAVMQAFPGAFGAEESDPFLMCDHFGPIESQGREEDPDNFPIDWHPHRGMDILTYMIDGVGRHADSMGNREEFSSPGMQWISVGSGIEHAEGGGTPAGETEHGFQIWVNVPSERKMEDPLYGTEPPENIPNIEVCEGVKARLLAGVMGEASGPFKTVQEVQMVDYVFEPNTSCAHVLPPALDNCLVYVYAGSGQIGGEMVPFEHVARLNADEEIPADDRQFEMQAGSKGLSAIIFAGKRLNQPVAWHGPFVMTTDQEIQSTIKQYRSGQFPPVRASWDYKVLSSKPSKA